MAPNLEDPLLESGRQAPAPTGGMREETAKTTSTELWRRARGKVKHAVRVKTQLLGLQSLAKNTALMRNKTQKEKQRYVAWVMFWIVVTGAMTAMTKSALFHMSAAGRWDNGHPYLFGYALSLTMIVFVLKVGLVFVEKLIHKEIEAEIADDKKGMQHEIEEVEDHLAHESLGQRICDWILPWVLLVAFTFFEMLSATVASLGLLYGAPTSVFVIFKSSKTIFLAILSVIFLRRKLNCAQWCALLFISMALILATCAEGKDKKKGEAEFNVTGPGLLLLSELFHATMLVLQEISVREYWTDPFELLSASAVIGVMMTGFTMYKMQNVWITLPDGGERPASDPVDSLIMCASNPLLLIVFATHLTVHVSQDVAHIVILKHISALARTLCDAVKLILMWGLGKVFWLFGIFPVVAEAWHPGLIGSWLMLPAIGIIIYSMLMFKHGVFRVFVPAEGSGPNERKAEEKGNIKVDLEEPFYIQMFTSKKLQEKMTARKVVGAKSFRKGFSMRRG